MSYWVYIARCADDTLYAGITTDVERRIDEHNGRRAGSVGAKYTAARRPVTLVYHAEFPNRSTASREEARIKQLTRIQKEALISSVSKPRS